jgi:hypothetical protein
MAMTNMVVMLGAMILQPMVGRLLDISLKGHITEISVEMVSTASNGQFYSAMDYQFALSFIPLGIIIAAILTFFLKETHADANN